MGVITEYQAQEIIDRYIVGEDCKNLAAIFGTTHKNIEKIIRGETWKKCQRPRNIKQLKLNNLYPEFSEIQHDILVGSLLGDGSLSNHVTSRFQKSQCVRYKEYLDWHFNVMSPYSASIVPYYVDWKLTGEVIDNKLQRNIVKKHISGFEYYTHCHPRFTALRSKWYNGDNKKIVPTDIDLTPRKIAIWFCDDGSNYQKQRKAVFCTQGFTFDEVSFLSERLKEFSIYTAVETSISKASELKQPFLRVLGNSYENLFELINPFIEYKCFEYKTNWQPRKYKILNENDVKNIVLLKNENNSIRKIAKMSGVSHTTISHLLSRKTKKHLHILEANYDDKVL